MVERTSFPSEPTLELLGKIIDISLDLRQNRSDSDFVANEGELFYVFDENIFEVFVRPRSRANIVNSFHSQNLMSERGRVETALDHQAALIASEYMLSEILPGSKRKIIYMTKEHRDELLWRLREVSTELSKNVEENEDAAIKELHEKLEILVGRIDKTSARQIKIDDKQLQEDSESLRGAGADDAVLRRFQLARIGTKLFAASTYTEPLEQLERLFTRPIFPRIRTLHLDFLPTSDELADIRSEGRKWLEKLKQERELDGKKRRKSGNNDPERTDSSLKNDADSLALIQWAATKTYTNQRMVLVTGDRLLLNAYRRWHVNLSPTEREMHPFLIRRASQYLPVFNMADSDNDISQGIEGHIQSRSIFSELLYLIEISLLPLNLSQYRTVVREFKNIDIPGRHHRIALALSYLGVVEDQAVQSLFDGYDKEWFDKAHAQIIEMLQKLRGVERFSLGAFLSTVMQRLSDEHRELAKTIEETGQANAGQVLQKYMTKLLASVRSKNVSSWPLLAEEFVRDLKPPQKNRRRIPLTIWYTLGDSGRISNLLEDWLASPRKINWFEIFKRATLRESPFIIAAVLALISDEWFQADRFSNIGVREFLAERPKPDVSDENYVEVLFLSALTKRFRLGNLETHVNDFVEDKSGQIVSRSLRHAEDIYQSALALLEQCLSISSEIKDSVRGTLWKMRALSERGSLRVFVAANMMPNIEDNAYGIKIQAAIEEILKARQDLELCFQLEHSIAKPGEYERQLNQVRRQYIPIYISTEVLVAISTESWPAPIEWSGGHVSLRLGAVPA